MYQLFIPKNQLPPLRYLRVYFSKFIRLEFFCIDCFPRGIRSQLSYLVKRNNVVCVSVLQFDYLASNFYQNVVDIIWQEAFTYGICAVRHRSGHRVVILLLALDKRSILSLMPGTE